jgi:hypothetical protein
MEIEKKKKKKLADGSSIAIPCVFSADATGAGTDVVVVVVVVDDDEEGDGVPVLGVVGSENISSSCNNKDDIFLSNYKSTREERNDSHTNYIQKSQIGHG